jgi:hypothetical protein
MKLYNHVKLSPTEALIYLGVNYMELLDLLRRHRVSRHHLTPFELDRIMGWHNPVDYKTDTSPRTVLDSSPRPRASILGWTPAEPYGTSDGTASTECRIARTPRRTAAQSQRKRTPARKPQSRRAR